MKEKARDNRLKGFGQVERREPESHLKKIPELNLPGKRLRGRLRVR